MSAKVIAVCISENKGERKTPVASVELGRTTALWGMPTRGSGTGR